MLQQWAEKQFGHAPAMEYFKSLLFATQWLVQNAILSGMKDAQIEVAKQSVKQLFYAPSPVFSAVICNRLSDQTGATQ